MEARAAAAVAGVSLWQDWTIFVTNCDPSADVGGRRRALPCAVADRTCSNSGVAQPAHDTPRRAAAEEQLAVVYVKLIAVLVQHWILLTATWCECRRSLMKAATSSPTGYVADLRPGRPLPTHRYLEPHEVLPP